MPIPTSGIPAEKPHSRPLDVVSASFDALLPQAQARFTASRAQSTRRAYAPERQDFQTCFQTWCHAHARISLPAAVETIIFYATDLTKNQKKKLNTLQRRWAAISPLHQEAGFPSPTQTWPLKQFLAGLRRELGVAPARKRPLLAEDLREILLDLPDTRLGKRDRALLLLGFSGAFRRSELVALDVTGLEETKDGLVVTIRKSKTDQEGQGRRVGLPPGTDEANCPLWA
jgi:integrase